MSIEAIRGAITAGEYGRATGLINEHARTLPVNETSLEELAALLEWASLSVRQTRAHAEARIQELRDELNVAAAYGG